MTKITVITICLNAEDTLRKAIESVLTQSYEDIEYVIVDGLSTDSTPDIIEQYKTGIGKYIREPDDGLYHAMNKGIANSSGDIIFFLNADDSFYDSGVVNSIVSQFEKSPSVDLVFGDVVWVHNNYETYYKQCSQVTRSGLARRTIIHQSIFARRELFQKMGNFCQEYRVVSDYEWILRVFLSGKCNYLYMAQPIVRFMLHGRSVSESWEAERREVMKKYFSAREIFRYRALPLQVEKLKKMLKKVIRFIKGRLLPPNRALTKNKERK